MRPAQQQHFATLHERLRTTQRESLRQVEHLFLAYCTEHSID